MAVDAGGNLEEYVPAAAVAAAPAPEASQLALVSAPAPDAAVSSSQNLLEWVARRAIAVRRAVATSDYLKNALAPFVVKGNLRGEFATQLDAVEKLCSAILELGVEEMERLEERQTEEREEMVTEEKLAAQAKEYELEARQAEAERQALELKRAHKVFSREMERISRERIAITQEAEATQDRYKASQQQKVQAAVDALAAAQAEADAELDAFRSRASAELAVKMTEFEQEFNAAKTQLEEEIAAYVDREGRDAAALAQAEHQESSCAQELADREAALDLAQEQAAEATRLEAAAWDVVKPQEMEYEEMVRKRQARYDAEMAACDAEEEKAASALQLARVSTAESLSEDLARADKETQRTFEDIKLRRMETQMGIDARTRKDADERAVADSDLSAAAALEEEATADDTRAEEALKESATITERVRLETEELLASGEAEREVAQRSAQSQEASALSTLAKEREPVERELERRLGVAKAEAEAIWAIDPIKIDADRTLADGQAAQTAWQTVADELAVAQGEYDLTTERRAQESRNKTKEWSDMETKFDAQLKVLRKQLADATEAARPEGEAIEAELDKFAKESEKDVAEIREKERRMRAEGEKLVMEREEVARTKQRKLEDEWFETQATRGKVMEKVLTVEEDTKSKKEWNAEALDLAGQAADELETLLRNQEKEMLSEKRAAEKEFNQLRAEVRDEEAVLDEKFQPEEAALREAIAVLRADMENDLAAMREELAAENLRHEEKVVPLEKEAKDKLKELSKAEAAVIEARTSLDKELARLQEETALRTRETESVAARTDELKESAPLLSATAQLRLVGVQLAALPLQREQPLKNLLQDVAICREEHARVDMELKNEKSRHERAAKRFDRMLERRKALFEDDASARTEELRDEKVAARAVLRARFEAAEQRMTAISESVQKGVDSLSELQDAASPALDTLALEEERVDKDRVNRDREAIQMRRRTELDAKKEKEDYFKAMEELATENREAEEKLAAELARIEAAIAEELSQLESRESERRTEVEIQTRNLAHVRRHAATAAKMLHEAEQSLASETAEKDSRFGSLEGSLASKQHELEQHISNLAQKEHELSSENNIKSQIMREGEAKRERKYAEVFHLVHAIEADLSEKRGGFDERLMNAQEARKEAEASASETFEAVQTEVERRREAAVETKASLESAAKEHQLTAKVKRDDAVARRERAAEKAKECEEVEAVNAAKASEELAVHEEAEAEARKTNEAKHEQARQTQRLSDAAASEAHASRMEEIADRRREASSRNRDEAEGEEVKNMQLEVLRADAREVAAAAQEAASHVQSCRTACDTGAVLLEEAGKQVESCRRDLKRSSTIANRERERVGVELQAVRRDIERDAEMVREEFGTTESELHDELYGPVREKQRFVDELKEKSARDTEKMMAKSNEELRQGLDELLDLERLAEEEFAKQEEALLAASEARVAGIEENRLSKAAERRKLRQQSAEAALKARYEHKERMSTFSAKLENAKAELDQALEQKREALRVEVEKTRRNEELRTRAKVEADAERRRLEIDSMLEAEKARLKLEAEQEMLDTELELLRMEEETRQRLEQHKADRMSSIEAERRAQRDAMEAEYRLQRERMETEMKRVESERLAKVAQRFAPVQGLLEAPAPAPALLEGPLPSLGSRPSSRLDDESSIGYASTKAPASSERFKGLA